MSNSLNDAVEDIKKVQQAVHDTVNESEDVKNGNCTAEEESAEPGRVLFDKISENVINILQNPDIVRVFVDIGKKFDEKTSQDLTVMMAVCMSQSAYQALLFYDSLLKDELQRNYDVFNNNINLCKSSIEAHESALTIFRKKLSDIDKKLMADEAIKEINK